MQSTQQSAAPERMSASKLSMKNLQRLQEELQPDCKYAENLAREESAQAFHQALYGYVRGEVRLYEASAHDPVVDIRDNTQVDIAQITRAYGRPEPSTTSPYQRFLTASHIAEPFPLLAKRAMSDRLNALGFQESVGVRSAAARRLAVSNKTGCHDSATSSDSTQYPCTVLLDCEVEVESDPKMRKTI